MAANTPNYNLKKPSDNDFFDQADANGNMDIIDAALAPTANPAQVPSGLSGNLTQWVSWITNRIKAITGKANWWDGPTRNLEELRSDIVAHVDENATTTVKGHVQIGATADKAAAGNHNHNSIYATIAQGVKADNAETPAGAQAKVDVVQGNLASHFADSTTAHGATSAAAASKIMMRDANGRAKVSTPSASDDIARKDNVDAVQNNLTNHASAADPHAVYIKHSLATAANDFLVASSAGMFVKKTLNETKSVIGAATTSTTGLVQLATAAEVTTGIDASKVIAPSTLKVELDKKISIAGGIMTGALVAKNGTDYTTKQCRNIALKTGADFTTGELANGEIGGVY